MTKSAMIFLLTGPKHSGKSSRAAELIQKAKSQGFQVGGILAPSRYVNGRLLGFDIINLHTGQRSLLSASDSESDGGGRFRFTETGEKIGRDALRPENLKKCRLIMIDEFGPFEIDGKGWRREIDLLVELNIAPLLMIVRDEIKQQVQAIYAIPEGNVFKIQDQEDVMFIIKKVTGHAEIR